MNGAMSKSLGFSWLKGKVADSNSASSSSKEEKKTRHITSTMRMERYYSSVREETSSLSASAAEILDRQDYIGFFKACGPNYIRGIRRVQELTALFSFESVKTEEAAQFATNLQTSAWKNEEKRSSLSKSLRINIAGFGLGLTEEGSETLVADSLEEYFKVMKFAFHTMTHAKNSVNIGMVYGIEIVPWVYNASFQVSAKLQDEIVELPTPLSLIPKAYHKSDSGNIKFHNDHRSTFRCKEPSYVIDKNGYCCDADDLYNFVDEVYNADAPEQRSCRPISSLDKALMKDNMANNGEFFVRLDKAVQQKLTQLATLEKCISTVRSIPEQYDFHLLKSQNTPNYDDITDFSITPFHLKIALDPFNDYSLIKYLGKELDEFIEMFYQPCLAALFGSNIGKTFETDATYFMALPWHTHEECAKLSCLGNGMRWDRSNGSGCVPGIIAGSSAHGYDNDDDRHCQKDPNSSYNACKHQSNDLKQFHSKVINRWESVLPKERIDYYIDKLCIPDLTDQTLSEQEQHTLRKAYYKTTPKNTSMNVALNKPCRQSSTYSTGSADKGVDGNQNVKWRNNGQTHTQTQSNPWWEVDLQGDFSIDRIVVHNRMDPCGDGPCKDRLDGFRVYVINSSGAKLNFGGRNDSPGRETTINPGTDVSGRKVRIELPGSNKILTLAEVEVFVRSQSL